MLLLDLADLHCEFLPVLLADASLHDRVGSLANHLAKLVLLVEVVPRKIMDGRLDRISLRNIVRFDLGRQFDSIDEVLHLELASELFEVAV